MGTITDSALQLGGAAEAATPSALAIERDVRTRSIAGVVKGTGFHDRRAVIRAHCKEGAAVSLHREPGHFHEEDAIGVWLQCSSWFGLAKSERMIGYLQSSQMAALASGLDIGATRIKGAYVYSYFAPRDLEAPQVTLMIHVIDR